MSKDKIAVPPQQRIRDQSGRFIKGQTGCSKSPGRPKLRDEFKAFAQEKSLEALQVVYSIMTDPETNQRDRTAAARLMMEYGYGRPSAEYDRERLDMDRQMNEAQIAKLQSDAPSKEPLQVIFSVDKGDYGTELDEQEAML